MRGSGSNTADRMKTIFPLNTVFNQQMSTIGNRVWSGRSVKQECGSALVGGNADQDPEGTKLRESNRTMSYKVKLEI